jgi:FixJ family two-component response regulator
LIGRVPTLRDQDLLDAIQSALEKDRDRQQCEHDLDRLRRRLELLTPREREVLPLVVSGRLNKQIASDLGTSEITVKVHRASIMRKMLAASVADLYLQVIQRYQYTIDAPIFARDL